MKMNCIDEYVLYIHKETINVASLDFTIIGKKIPFLTVDLIKTEKNMYDILNISSKQVVWLYI